MGKLSVNYACFASRVVSVRDYTRCAPGSGMSTELCEKDVYIHMIRNLLHSRYWHVKIYVLHLIGVRTGCSCGRGNRCQSLTVPHTSNLLRLGPVLLTSINVASFICLLAICCVPKVSSFSEAFWELHAA